MHLRHKCITHKCSLIISPFQILFKAVAAFLCRLQALLVKKVWADDWPAEEDHQPQHLTIDTAEGVSHIPFQPDISSRTQLLDSWTFVVMDKPRGKTT